jgi:hypothetical protein
VCGFRGNSESVDIYASMRLQLIADTYIRVRLRLALFCELSPSKFRTNRSILKKVRMSVKLTRGYSRVVIINFIQSVIRI